MYFVPIDEKYYRMREDELDSRIWDAKNALGERVVILGHHYQRDDVIKFADYRGDSCQVVATYKRPTAWGTGAQYTWVKRCSSRQYFTVFNGDTCCCTDDYVNSAAPLPLAREDKDCSAGSVWLQTAS